MSGVTQASELSIQNLKFLLLESWDLPTSIRYLGGLAQALSREQEFKTGCF